MSEEDYDFDAPAALQRAFETGSLPVDSDLHSAPPFAEWNAGVEVRKVSETGGEKGQKEERFDLIPAGPLRAVAKHYGIGSRKYEDRNWERGYPWDLSFGAMMRHAWAFWNGEDVDPETGSPHMAAVVFHALALMEFARTHPEFDTRPGKEAV